MVATQDSGTSDKSGVYQDAPMLGVALMLMVSLFGAIDSVLVRHLSPDVHPFTMGFTRALFGLLVMLPWIVARPQILKSHYRFRHVVRAALKLASLIAYFMAFASAGLADVTAIAFASPIFVFLGALLFLGESADKQKIAAVLVGFLGVLLVLRPGGGEQLSTGLLFALLGALLTAIIQLILKPMSRFDSTETLVAWNLVVTVPLALIPALWIGEVPSLNACFLLALQGVLGALAMACVTRAFAYADASIIAPLDFLRLPLVAVFGYVFFAETVPLSTWLGGGVIFAATLLMANHARTRKRSY